MQLAQLAQVSAAHGKQAIAVAARVAGTQPLEGNVSPEFLDRRAAEEVGARIHHSPWLHLKLAAYPAQLARGLELLQRVLRGRAVNAEQLGEGLWRPSPARLGAHAFDRPQH